MNYTIQPHGEAVVFRLQEPRLNASHAPELKAALTVLAHEHQGPVVVDLSAVQSLDSAVLSALLLLRRLLEGQGRPLALVAPTPGVQSVFSLSRLNEIFTLMQSIDEALLYLQNQASLLMKKKAEEEEEEFDEEEDWDEEELEDWEEEEEDWEEDWDEEDWDEEEWDEEDWEEEEEDWEGEEEDEDEEEEE
ncbi:MAG: hypothetical protein KatS3mg026_1400 [Bacteroidia bacterium]|nr:MAG: hypothetical protein KatS3mg026_1400 [Bacteroidia bacterium]